MVRLSAAWALAVLGAVSTAAQPDGHGHDHGARDPMPADDCIGVKGISPKCSSQQSAYYRDAFYVGGRYIPTASGNVTADQLYVEKLTPSCGVRKQTPLVFFHGGAGSGVTWLNTPDGRKGFASYFLDQGYQVYLLDHTSVGRSSNMDTADNPLSNTTTVESVRLAFAAPEIADTYPQAHLHTQWPGVAELGDPTFEAFRKLVVPFTSNWTAGELSMRAAGCDLLELIGPSYLISHSSGSWYSILLSNDCPQNVAGSINLEHSTQPFWDYGSTLNSGTPNRPWGLANTPLTYDPPISDPSELVQEIVGQDTLAKRNCHLQAEPARQLPAISQVPYLCVTSEASVHITYDHCVIEYLKQAGGSPDWIKLADIGIHGNAHFMHIEKNNLDIAAVVEKWITDRDS